MALRIIVKYRDAESVREFSRDKIVIGRGDATQVPDLPLVDDPYISRQHALVELKDGVCWLTDLGSKSGTRINGRDIRGKGECRVAPDDAVQVGETKLRFVPVPASAAAEVPVSQSTKPPSPPPFGERGFGPKPWQPSPSGSRPASPLPPRPTVIPLSIPAKGEDLGLPSEKAPVSPSVAASDPSGPTILQTIDTTKGAALDAVVAGNKLEVRASVFQDFALDVGESASQDQLLEKVLERAIKGLPLARRGAVALRDPQRNSLVLKAYMAEEPSVSQTLMWRVMDEKRAFIWRSGNTDLSSSVIQYKIVTGLYAPLQWRDQVFGVIYVDSPEASDTFDEGDLRFLIALGQYAGMALAGLQADAELRRKGKLLDRLMANFSPKLRTVLLEQALQGKLRPGGVKSEVTLLFLDLCGFTQRSAQLDAHDVVEMLNHYFERLLEIILLYDGTVDKFIGDGVLAVFGSPEADPQQHHKAVQAAVALQEAMRAMNQQRANRGDPACPVRLGLHCGEVFHGFLGTTDRLEFTVIGDAVNRTARYCQAAGEGEIVISRDLFQHVFSLIRTEKVTVNTKEGELSAYRVLGLRT